MDFCTTMEMLFGLKITKIKSKWLCTSLSIEVRSVQRQGKFLTNICRYICYGAVRQYSFKEQ